MRNKLILPGLMALLLLTIVPADAAPPQTIVTSTTPGLVILYPPFDYVLQGAGFVFNFHVYNATDGMPITQVNNISCVFHLYNQSGSHIYTKDPVTAMSGYDYSISAAAGNFSGVGFYSVIIQCNNSRFGGADRTSFKVTDSAQIGVEPPSDNRIIFFLLAVIATVGMYLYLFAYSAQKFGAMKFDMMDLVYNLIYFIWLLAFNLFNTTYFGNATLTKILLGLIVAAVWSHIVAPVYFYIICYFRNLIDVRMMGGKNGK